MMPCMSLQINITLHLTHTFYHSSEIIIFVRRNTKRETNKVKEKSQIQISIFLKISCSEILLYESLRRKPG